MWTCYCCGRDLPGRAIEHKAVNEDGEQVSVGSDCIKKIVDARFYGHESSCGNGNLFSIAVWEESQGVE